MTGPIDFAALATYLAAQQFATGVSFEELAEKLEAMGAVDARETLRILIARWQPDNKQRAHLRSLGVDVPEPPPRPTLTQSEWRLIACSLHFSAKGYDTEMARMALSLRDRILGWLGDPMPDFMRDDAMTLREAK